MIEKSLTLTKRAHVLTRNSRFDKQVQLKKHLLYAKTPCMSWALNLPNNQCSTYNQIFHSILLFILKDTLSVIGGLTLTVPKPKAFTASTMM